MPRQPTRRERERERRARSAANEMARIKSQPAKPRSAVDGDLYALRWEHDGLECVAELGRPVPGYSSGPVLMIVRGEADRPFVVVATDRPEGFMVGSSTVIDLVEFAEA